MVRSPVIVSPVFSTYLPSRSTVRVDNPFLATLNTPVLVLNDKDETKLLSLSSEELNVIVLVELLVVIVIPPLAAKVSVVLLVFAVTLVCPDFAIVLNIFCELPLSLLVIVIVPLVVIGEPLMPKPPPLAIATLCTVPVVLEPPMSERI